MSTAILLPVLGRPHRIRPLLENIEQATPEPHRVVFAASDSATLYELMTPAGTARPNYDVLIDDGRSWPERINLLYRATNEPFVFLGADDLLFHPGWLSAALYAMSGFDPLGGVVAVNDLHNPNGTAALISRGYVEELGGTDKPGQVIHPGYSHCFCDDELWGWAKARGRYAYCAESVVEHLHPAAGKSEDDSTYRKGISTLVEDRALFESRRSLWE